MEFTADQQKIIDSRNKNLLVSAAAGSGKTTVLVERIMSLVTDRDDPCDIGEILVVTFTRAAAANMKNKISEAFRKRIEMEGPDPRLSRQAILVHSAKIMTLDTFCLSVIRDHFPETGLDPAFRVAADGEANLIKKDVYASVMEDRYLSDDNEDFLDMCEAFSAGKDDSGVERIVEKLYNVAESYPWPVKWLEEHGAAYDENDPLVIEFTAEKVLSMLRRARNVLFSALEICDLPGGPEPYRDAIETVIASIDRASVSFSKNGAWDPSAIETITFPKRAQVRGNAYSPELKERCSAEWKKAATIVKNAVKTALPLSEGTSADPVCAEHLKSLTELTIDFIEAYAAEKEKRGVIDFSDMGHLALRILARENEDGTIEPTDTALEYRKIFREVMCDEYQDSNLVQEIILSAIAGKDPEVCSRFMVGDV
ncbi:MAG: UvrD-helicase domain-containing protein, partial [Lachnospiraceae bacterium]|nr:UvrD-helicase domain-containing protein [Lachnospiraceae bacterium]